MQVVIDISEKDYQTLKKKDKFDAMYLNYYEKLIVYGTPLPKGHGRLIDADKFLKDNEAYTGFILDSRFFGGKNAYKDALEDLVDEAPTIIEADREV